MRIFKPAPITEPEIKTRILEAAEQLFAKHGYEGTTTRELAQAVGIAEGTLFRHFPTKKAILTEVVTQGWIEILTDLLTELSEMKNFQTIQQVLQHRMMNMTRNWARLKVCFMESQAHPDLQEHIQTNVISKMTDVAEVFFATAIERGIYRPMNPKIVAHVFLGMFAIAGFSQNTLLEPGHSLQGLQEMSEGLADIFLHGVLAKN
jgi:AcrR family transcriptional regulator